MTPAGQALLNHQALLVDHLLLVFPMVLQHRLNPETLLFLQDR